VSIQAKREKGKERRAEILRLWIHEGWTQQRIADHLGITHSTVCQHLAKAKEELKQRHEDALEAYKAQQIERLQGIYDRAMEGWHRSVGETVKVTTKTGRVHVPRGEGEPIDLPDEVTREVVNQAGGAQYLGQAMKAIEGMRELLGLDAPKRTDVTSDGEAVKAYIGIDLDKV
jgi:predicted transcriptional regulator